MRKTDSKAIEYDPYGCFSFAADARAEDAQVCTLGSFLAGLQEDHKEDWLYHGSNDGSLVEFHPQQSESSTDFASKKAVFATDLLPLAALYAIINRNGLKSRVNGCFLHAECLYYYYSIDHVSKSIDDILTHGFLYTFDKSHFFVDPSDPHHWACESSVKPCNVLKPNDVPFCSELWMHDSNSLMEKINTDGYKGVPFFRDRRIYWHRPERFENAQPTDAAATRHGQ